jgi:hypothetical protein
MGDAKDSLTRCLWDFGRISGYRRETRLFREIHPFDHQLRFKVPETPSTFHPRAQRNAFRRRDVRPAKRSMPQE